MSIYLLAAGSAWLVSQLAKYTLHVLKTKRIADIDMLYQSGSMPSVHTATVVALIIAVAKVDGLHSGLFAITLIFGVIVAYDAMQVRRAAGEQGLALKELLVRAKILTVPYHALGHRPIEVLGGAIVGVIVGTLVVFFAS
jgi:acid phosphatase family membrane protein YuiD